MAVFNCRNCGHKQAVDDKFLGKTATCPKCKTQGEVGRLDDETPVTNAISTPDAKGYEHHTERSVRRKWVARNGNFISTASSLMMEWICIDDPSLPIGFHDICGITPGVDGYRSVDLGSRVYSYSAFIKALVRDAPVSAFEVRFLTFDIWGEHAETLSAFAIHDLAPGQTHECEFSWPLYSETDGLVHGASLAFVSRVRTRDGKVSRADTAHVLREAKRFSEVFTEDDLEPTPAKKT